MILNSKSVAFPRKGPPFDEPSGKSIGLPLIRFSMHSKTISN